MSLILDALRRSENGGVTPSPQPPLPAEQGGGLGKNGWESSYWSAPGWVLPQGG